MSQGIAGYLCGCHICEKVRTDVSVWVRRAYGMHHAALYFGCSFAGFAAWTILVSFARKIADWSALSAGTVCVLAAIAAFAVVAISGALARILYMGQKPW